MADWAGHGEAQLCKWGLGFWGVGLRFPSICGICGSKPGIRCQKAHFRHVPHELYGDKVAQNPGSRQAGPTGEGCGEVSLGLSRVPAQAHQSGVLHFSAGGVERQSPGCQLREAHSPRTGTWGHRRVSPCPVPLVGLLSPPSLSLQSAGSCLERVFLLGQTSQESPIPRWLSSHTWVGLS